MPTGSLKTARKNRSVYAEKDAAKYEGDGGESDRCGDVGEGARGDGHTGGGGCGGEGAVANQEEAARGQDQWRRRSGQRRGNRGQAQGLRLLHEKAQPKDSFTSLKLL